MRIVLALDAQIAVRFVGHDRHATESGTAGQRRVKERGC